MAISDQSLTSNETLFLALTKNAYKNVGPHGLPDLNGSCLQLLAIRSKSHPASKFNPPPPTISPGIFRSLLIFPHPIIYFKQQYVYFKMKLITYLKSANRVTHNHLVLRTTFHNKQMMSSSGDLVLSFLYLHCYLPLN